MLPRDAPAPMCTAGSAQSTSAADRGDAVTGEGVAAVPALAADVDWALPAVHIGAGASRGSILPSLYVSLGALQAFDGYSTTTGLRRGATETNGMMKNVAGNPASMWIVKGGVTAVSIYAAERLWKRNRRVAAIATMVATNGLMAMVAARNASVLRAQR